MARHDLLMYAPVLTLLVWAAIEDLYSRRIRNWLTVSLALGGIACAILYGRPLTPVFALLGLLVGFSLTLPLFGLGAIGAGDVKLLAALGAWLGPMGAFKVFIIETVVGMLIVLIQAVIQGRTRVLFRNSTVVALNLIHMNDVGVDQAMATGQSSHSVDRPLPYAVPVLIATLLLLAGGV